MFPFVPFLFFHCFLVEFFLCVHIITVLLMVFPFLFRPSDMSEFDYESLPTDKLWAHLLAGGAAGIMEHCVMYPVDCVKVSSVW